MQRLQTEQIVSLQVILTQQSNEPVSVEEAEEIGESMLNFFEALATEEEEDQ